MIFVKSIREENRDASPSGLGKRPVSLSKNPKLAAVARKQRFAARPAMRGGLRTAVALRAVLVLGAAHP